MNAPRADGGLHFLGERVKQLSHPREGEFLPDGRSPAEPYFCEHPADELRPIAPPRPAPYLAAAPSLPAELLAEMAGHKWLLRPLDDRAQALIDTAKAVIRFRREQYEQQHGVVIIPERPAT